MDETGKLIGNRIRTLRKRMQLSQEQLAENVNLSSKYLGEIERGQVNFSVDIAVRLAEGLQVELADLLDYQHEKSRGELISTINHLMQNANDDELKTIYRILNSVLK